ncbi:hypothetical protein [Streptomyces syringium]|uniref:hypothetical protein n=2 Tax=Streptomyces TaxID=1883 RepID=UPI00341C5097
MTTVEGDTVGAGDYSRAVCPDGTQLVGGGYGAESKYTDGGAYADSVDLNAPLNGGVWRAQSHKGWIKAYALCDSASAPTRVAMSGKAVKGGEMSFAKCPDGTNLVTGGYEMVPSYGAGGIPHDSVDMNAPAPSHGVDRSNTWAAMSHNKDGHIWAYALCRQNR